MRPWEIVSVRGEGEFSKARPALVIYADFAESPDYVIVCPLCSSASRPIPATRYVIIPDQKNGLKYHSQICMDKMQIVRRENCKEPFGAIDDTDVECVKLFLKDEIINGVFGELEKILTQRLSTAP